MAGEKKTLYPFKGQVFQWDIVPNHTGKFITEWLKDHKDSCFDWQTQKPDLSPLKNKWDSLYVCGIKMDNNPDSVAPVLSR